jgi:hypothetical protein
VIWVYPYFSLCTEQMRVNPHVRAIAQCGRPSDRSERIGKKPNEADLSYTAVCTGLSNVFISDRKIGKEAKGNEGARNKRNSGAYAERGNCGEKRRL